MKMIHCADLHLDAQVTANLSQEQARERKKEILRTFLRMVDYAKKNDVNVILIAGDLFDTRNVSALARNVVRDAILEHPEIDFLYLRGPYDADGFLAGFGTLPSNLKLFEDAWITYRYGNVAITGMELSMENDYYLYEQLEINPQDYNIVTLYGQVVPGRSLGDASRIGLAELKDKNIDYLALGHVHNYQIGRVDARGYYCYSGSLEGMSFEECGNKGFVLLEINEETMQAQMKFVPVASRNYYRLSVDVTGVMSTQEAAKRIKKELQGVDYPRKSLVSIELEGAVDVECDIDTEALRELFFEYFYYERVLNRTRLNADYRDYEKDASLKGEFIRMVLKSDMDEEKKAQVIRCGILALSGEEISL